MVVFVGETVDAVIHHILQRGYVCWCSEFHFKTIKIVMEPGAQVVEHADGALALQGFDEMTADKSGTAGDKNAL